MWCKFIVTAQHIGNGQTREVEIGCMGEREALTLGRIWFPEGSYTGHSAKAKPRAKG